MDILEAGDIENAIIAELEELGYDAGSSLPGTLPTIFVRVLAIGGAPRDLVTDVPTVTLEFFGRTETAAVRAARRGLAVLEARARTGSLGGETCYGLSVVSLPQNYPLPSVQTHKRYITTIAPAVRRRTVTI